MESVIVEVRQLTRAVQDAVGGMRSGEIIAKLSLIEERQQNLVIAFDNYKSSTDKFLDKLNRVVIDGNHERPLTTQVAELRMVAGEHGRKFEALQTGGKAIIGATFQLFLTVLAAALSMVSLWRSGSR